MPLSRSPDRPWSRPGAPAVVESPARSTAPTPARSRSRSRTAGCSSSTARRRQSADRRLHLRQGAAAPGASLRPRPDAHSDSVAWERKETARFEPHLLGRGPRSRGDEAGRDPRPLRRRSDPALLLRRLERPAVTGHDRRPALPPARRLAPRAHGLRRGDRARRPIGLYGKMEGVAYPGLRHAAPDRRLGRQSLGVRHPPRAADPGGARRRRQAASSSIRARRRSPSRPISTSRCARAPISSLALAVDPRALRERAGGPRLPRRHATGVDELERRAEPWTIDRAAAVAGVPVEPTSRASSSSTPTPRRR